MSNSPRLTVERAKCQMGMMVQDAVWTGFQGVMGSDTPHLSKHILLRSRAGLAVLCSIGGRPALFNFELRKKDPKGFYWFS